MPSGVHNNHTKLGGTKAKCNCGSCNACKHRSYMHKTGRQKSVGFRIEDKDKFELGVDNEPLYDDLTLRLIERFAE